MTVPKEIRDKLKANAVYFEAEDDIVMVRAVRDAAGILREFSSKVKPGESMKEERNKAWVEAVRQKNGKKSKGHG